MQKGPRRKVTRTTVKEYDEDGKLVAEDVTVRTQSWHDDPDPVVGFSPPVRLANKA